MLQITRIDAVNRILRMKTAERVSTQDELDTIPQAVAANNLLDASTQLVQIQFEWAFNSIIEASRTSDVDGNITLPNNLGFVDFIRTDAAAQLCDLRPVDGRVYDIRNATFDMGASRTVWYNGRVVWAFEELPAAFQMLAVAQARKEEAGSGTHMSPDRLAIERNEWNDAFQTALKFDSSFNGGRTRPYGNTRRSAPRNRGWV